MTMLEKAARAAEECMTAHISSSIKYDAEYIGGRIARAVLEAVRVPSDDFMLSLYPNPKIISADGGAEAGDRSRRAGKMQIDYFISTILTEGKSNDPE